MMRKKKITIPIYFSTLVIIECKSFDSLPKKYKTGLGIEYSAAVMKRTKKNGQIEYVVAFTYKPEARTIAHESVHIVNHIFNDRFISLDLLNDEPQAYLTGWVVKKINDFFK